MVERRSPRATAGRSLLVSALVLLILALLFAGGVLEIDRGARRIVVVFLGVAAVCDAAIGLWFMKRPS